MRNETERSYVSINPFQCPHSLGSDSCNRLDDRISSSLNDLIYVPDSHQGLLNLHDASVISSLVYLESDVSTVLYRQIFEPQASVISSLVYLESDVSTVLYRQIFEPRASVISSLLYLESDVSTVLYRQIFEPRASVISSLLYLESDVSTVLYRQIFEPRASVISSLKLSSQCRTSSEVDLVLKQREGCDFPGAFIFPRLKLAMQYNQKEFVAHPNTQKVLLLAWRGDWHEWYMRCQLLKGVTVFSRIFMLPAIAAICACAPNTALAQRWRLPINKMINSMAAYFIFLLLIFLESNLDKKHQKRGPPQSGKLNANSLGYDSITHLLFLLTFIFWLSALVEKETSNIPDDLERKYWHHLDSILMAEGFFAVATILAFGRLLLLCQLNYYLGPLQKHPALTHTMHSMVTTGNYFFFVKDTEKNSPKFWLLGAHVHAQELLISFLGEDDEGYCQICCNIFSSNLIIHSR
uniref:Uncharacterized protein n=1 Tax=Timema cristinae TaxID=61476 RepID=A0A7R9DBN9_TIMCR|nr:unnamed protein product [Timema cristinae]